jgi:dihydroorotate dehydrogenase (fumarate)
MLDLGTRYLGLDLPNPVVASASPLSKEVDAVRALEDAGAAAVVMYSLFEEQINHESLELDHFLVRGSDSFSEAMSFFPDLGHYNLGTEGYLEQVAALKRAVDMPVIGSLNGVSSGGWLEYAGLIEEAGADALELNIYFVPADPATSAAELEDEYVTLVRQVRAETRLPLAVKLSPFFTALPHFAARLVDAGADALVLFNRFYQPDFDLEALEVAPTLNLSRPEEIRLPLLWIAILSGRLDASLAASTGVHSPDEVIKYLLAGADAVMTTSALLERGPGHLESLRAGLAAWMERRGYTSVEQMKGSMSQRSVADPSAFERANYIKILESFQPPSMNEQAMVRNDA